MMRHRGFTLLEVLVAAFILFLVITAMTMVYRGAMTSSAKAQRVVEMVAVVPQLRQHIGERLFKASNIQPQQGEGDMEGIAYRWQAVPMLRGQPFHPGNNFISTAGSGGATPSNTTSLKLDDAFLGLPTEQSPQAEPALDPTGRPLGMESTTLWLWQVTMTVSLGNAQRQYDFWVTTW